MNPDREPAIRDGHGQRGRPLQLAGSQLVAAGIITLEFHPLRGGAAGVADLGADEVFSVW